MPVVTCDHLLLIELLCRAGFEFTQSCVHSSSLRIHLGKRVNSFIHRGRQHEGHKEEIEGMRNWDIKKRDRQAHNFHFLWEIMKPCRTTPPAAGQRASRLCRYPVGHRRL
jgi:hypothetical protein